MQPALTVIRERQTLLRRVFGAADGVAVVMAFAAAYVLRRALPFPSLAEPRDIWAYVPVLLAALPLWLVPLHHFGAYASFRRTTIPAVLALVAKSVVVALLALSWFLFFFHFNFVSRAFLLAFGAFGFLALTAERVGVLVFFRAVRRRGYNYRNILVAGTSRRARELTATIDAHAEWGLRIVGLAGEPSLRGRLIGGHRVLGTLADLPRLTRERVIDEVVFVMPRARLGEIEQPLQMLDELGIKASVALDLFDLPLGRPKLGEFEGIPTLTYSSTPPPEGPFFVKRLCDRMIAAVLLLLLSPLLLAIALAIRLTSAGPVLFRQERVGLHGRRFMLLKFRSMVQDAERRQAALLALNEMTGPVFKLKRDPRVTPVGRWLRKLSLDELPQLVNVLRGEMSLVGPRPPLAAEVEQYKSWQRRRLSMPPGLTCLWQISGRNRIDFETWMKMDLEYIDTWSLALDAKILMKTVPAVLSGSGAS